uniref:Uncharacterized protein n=1 Tax=Piliocolobus tephrosceles TaxID=591936 RepID=A0A8C9I7M0_9PRIM
MQAPGPGSGGESTPWASTAWLHCEHSGAYLGTDRESCARCSGAHLGTKGPCFYWRIWTDVKAESHMCEDMEDSNSRRFLIIFCARHWRLGWWHFMLLTFLSHYFSCDCRLLALYSEGGERTTAPGTGEGMLLTAQEVPGRQPSHAGTLATPTTSGELPVTRA